MISYNFYNSFYIISHLFTINQMGEYIIPKYIYCKKLGSTHGSVLQKSPI